VLQCNLLLRRILFKRAGELLCREQSCTTCKQCKACSQTEKILPCRIQLDQSSSIYIHLESLCAKKAFLLSPLCAVFAAAAHYTSSMSRVCQQKCFVHVDSENSSSGHCHSVGVQVRGVRNKKEMYMTRTVAEPDIEFQSATDMSAELCAQENSVVPETSMPRPEDTSSRKNAVPHTK
jgi:hypothetical protein